MAKRYIRINWQNAPSVATPRNAENLNIMDKGIDDLDLYKIDTDAIVNNGVTTAAGTVLDGRMGKTLQDQVTTINNNLTDIKSSGLTSAVGTTDVNTGYIKAGRVVILVVRINLTQNISSRTALLSGLPTPLIASAINIFNASSGAWGQGYIDSNGTVQAVIVADTGRGIVVSGSYIAAN